MPSYKVKSDIEIEVEADNKIDAKIQAWDKLRERNDNYPIEEKLDMIITSWTKVEKNSKAL